MLLAPLTALTAAPAYPGSTAISLVASRIRVRDSSPSARRRRGLSAGPSLRIARSSRCSDRYSSVVITTGQDLRSQAQQESPLSLSPFEFLSLNPNDH